MSAHKCYVCNKDYGNLAMGWPPLEVADYKMIAAAFAQSQICAACVERAARAIGLGNVTEAEAETEIEREAHAETRKALKNAIAAVREHQDALTVSRGMRLEVEAALADAERAA